MLSSTTPVTLVVGASSSEVLVGFGLYGSSVGAGPAERLLLVSTVLGRLRRLEGLCVTTETKRVVVMVTMEGHNSVAIGGLGYPSLDPTLEAGRGM